MPPEKPGQGQDEYIRRIQEEEEVKREHERGFREQDPYWGLNRNFTRMMESLRTIANSKSEKEKREARELLPIYHERFMLHLILDGERDLDNALLQFENMVPFKNSQGDSSLEATQVAIDTTLLEEKWAKTEEAKYWLSKTARDGLWLLHNRRLQMGMSGMVNKMYDWEKILNQVQEAYRKDPINLSYEQTYKAKLRAKGLPSEIDGRALTSQEAYTLREKGIRYTADNVFWNRAIVGVGQAEYVNGERRSMGAFDTQDVLARRWVEGLSDREFKFIQLMFGADENGNWSSYSEDNWVTYEGRKYPHQILAWQAMTSTQFNKETYTLIANELLTRNIRHELEKPDYGDDDALKTLVKIIKESVIKRREEMFTPFIPSEQFGQDKYLDSKLADYVIKSEIVFNWGHKSAVHMNWQWNYDEEKGRKKSGGGVTTATDAATGPMWREFHLTNIKRNWTTGTLPHASAEYIEMLENKRPDFLPGLRDLSPKASVSDEERRTNELQSKAFQRLKAAIMKANPDVWNYYYSNTVWYWETSYQDEMKRNLVLPMWIPPVFESVDYFHAIPWDPKQKIKLQVKGEGDNKTFTRGLTLHEALEMGYDISEKDWSEAEAARTPDMAYYRHLITTGQLLKIIHIMTAKPELASQELNTFFGVSAMFDEWNKRDELGPRDEVLPIAIINAALTPLLIMEVTGRIKNEIFTVTGSSKVSIGDWIARDLEEWRRVIAKSVPEEREGIKGYRDIMLAFFDFYFTQYAKAGRAVGQTAATSEVATEKYLRKLVSEMEGIDGIPYSSPALRPEKPIGK